MTRSIITAIVAVILSAAAAVAAPVTITPSSDYVTRQIKVPSFTGVTTNTAIDITYTVGPQKVELYAPSNMVQYIRVSVEDGSLTVKYTENMTIKGKHQTVLRVTAPAVSRFRTNSAGDIKILSDLRLSGECSLQTNSAGDITARNITATTIKCMTNSAGDIDAQALDATNVILTCNSAGDIDVTSVKARSDAKLTCNSAGDIEVRRLVAGQQTTAYCNSAGDIEVSSLHTTSLAAASNSSGDLKLTGIAAQSVSGATNSAGTVTLSGNCSTASFNTTSVGDVVADKLKALDVTVEIRSNGDVRCNAVNTLTVKRMGRGVVYTAGNPARTVVSDSRRDSDSAIRKL